VRCCLYTYRHFMLDEDGERTDPTVEQAVDISQAILDDWSPPAPVFASAREIVREEVRQKAIESWRKRGPNGLAIPIRDQTRLHGKRIARGPYD
jgi:hypothetical protein